MWLFSILLNKESIIGFYDHLSGNLQRQNAILSLSERVPQVGMFFLQNVDLLVEFRLLSALALREPVKNSKQE